MCLCRRKTRPKINRLNHHDSDDFGKLNCKYVSIWMCVILTCAWLFSLSYMLAIIHSEYQELNIDMKKCKYIIFYHINSSLLFLAKLIKVQICMLIVNWIGLYYCYYYYHFQTNRNTHYLASSSFVPCQFIIYSRITLSQNVIHIAISNHWRQMMIASAISSGR